jgi:hypothetical protein
MLTNPYIEDLVDTTIYRGLLRITQLGNRVFPILPQVRMSTNIQIIYNCASGTFPSHTLL